MYDGKLKDMHLYDYIYYCIFMVWTNINPSFVAVYSTMSMLRERWSAWQHDIIVLTYRLTNSQQQASCIRLIPVYSDNNIKLGVT